MSIPQEPYVDRFKNKTISEKLNTTYTDFFREASLKRYALHQYQYSYIHKASTDAIVYFKPMFYNFPDDEKNYEDVEKNILLGDSVKLSVVVDNKTENNNLTEKFYFPGNDTKWCPIWPKYNLACYDGKSYQSMEVEYDEMLVYIKSGSIIPLQLTNFTEIGKDNPDYTGYEKKILNTSKDYSIDTLKTYTLDLAVMCDTKKSAKGWVRFDDGQSKDINLYTEYSFKAEYITPENEAEKLNITVTSTKNDFKQPEGSKNQKLGSVLIYSAKDLGYTDNSKCSIKIDDDKTIETKPFCYFTGDNQSNICRFMVEDDQEPDLKDIKDITLTKE